MRHTSVGRKKSRLTHCYGRPGAQTPFTDPTSRWRKLASERYRASLALAIGAGAVERGNLGGRQRSVKHLHLVHIAIDPIRASRRRAEPEGLCIGVDGALRRRLRPP